MNKKPLILWADDEIELLRPHVLFLENHGYEIVTVNNGLEVIEMTQTMPVDIVILDEHMPGVSGLKSLELIKEKFPHIPVIMITKSEEEDIMNKAIGSKIADYLIKPVNPRQILSSLKKFTDGERLVSQTSASRYVNDFRQISESITNCRTISDWTILYQKLMYWSYELSSSGSSDESISTMRNLLSEQLREAERVYFGYIKRNYRLLLNDENLIMSHKVVENSLIPLLKSGESPWFVIIDNFRLDQWYAVRNMMSEFFRFEESVTCSILPTTTQYARNAIFAGKLPSQIKKRYPDKWIEENSKENKNQYEEILLTDLLDRNNIISDIRYIKINDSESCEKLITSFNEIKNKRLKVLVISFIDTLSHERTNSRTIRELAYNEASFRAITESWFRHSPLSLLFSKIAAAGQKIVLTTDHGTILVERPVKVFADKTTSDTLRYKTGINMKYEGKDVMEITDPDSVGLPASRLSSEYLFVGCEDFFVYQNSYNRFVKQYENTYQHGGISMQEMLVPLITLIPK